MKPDTDIRRAEDALNVLKGAIRSQPDDFEHPGYEQFEALVDGRLTDTDREIIETHIASCATCAQDVADLTGVRDALRVAGSTPPRAVAATHSEAWRAWHIAAAVLVVVGIGMVGRRLLAPGIEPAAPATTARDGSAPTSGAPDLQVRGVAGPKGPALQDSERTLVDRVLASGQLEMPAAVRSLMKPAGTLLGDAPSSAALAPLSPIGTAVASASPQFTWRKIDGATAYTVAVFDDRFNEVARSGRISGTSWTPTNPLPRGATLAWQVTAHLPARDILAPEPPQPEARFIVVDAATASSVAAQQARLSGQPLELGVLLANAGLFDDAARELAKAAKDPATADRARTLLASLRK